MTEQTNTPTPATPENTPATAPTPKRNRSKKTAPATPATLTSITPGDRAYTVTPATRSLFTAQYPDLVTFLTGSDYTAGREYTVYVSHIVKNESGKSHRVTTFLRFAGNRKNLTVKKPDRVQFDLTAAKKSFPAIRSLIDLTDPIIIIGYFGRREFRAIHISFKF